MKKKTFRSFEDARKFVHTLGLKNEKDDWRTYSKSGKRPDDIPTNPYNEYKKQGTWTSWPDFLGSYKTNPRSVPKKSEWSYDKAKVFLKKLGVTSKEDFYRLKKLGKIPKEIPSGAATIYKDKGWVSWGDFVGTGNIGYGDRVYKSFTDAREFVQNLGFTRQDQWEEYIDSGNLPSDIPMTPRYAYKEEWTSMGDWLGTGRKANKDKEFWSYAKAKEFVIKIGIKSSDEFRKGRTDGRIPEDIPSNPNGEYVKEWEGWGKFLGTGVLAHKDKEFWNYAKAKEFVIKNKVPTRNDFNQLCKEGKIPKEIPRNVVQYYKKEWQGWGDFLGTGYIANQNREYLSAKEARIEIAKIAKKVFGSKKFNPQDWYKAYDEDKIPKNLPKYLDFYDPDAQRNQRRKKK